MSEEIKNELMIDAMRNVCAIAKKLGLESVELNSTVTVDGWLIVHVNEVLIGEVRCDNINIYDLAAWFELIAYIDREWQIAEEKLYRQQLVDSMIKEFDRIVLKSA